ncbi:MAG: GNAT family N-acetyltransferase [Abitibacteriaceae bacterium]|nr:GNAT family N-acetyltransferase [Abditibacteriaceae bacterium]
MLTFSHPTPAAIPDIVELWNAAFGPDLPMTARLLRQTVEGDPYYDPEGVWIAQADGQLVGWVLSKSMQSAGPELGRFQGRGGIGGLCVHPDYQRRGIATQLLDRAENYLRASGSPVTTLYFPHHLLPGIPAECEAALALFKKRGYSGFNLSVDMWHDLTDYALPAKVKEAMANNPEVELRPAQDGEVDAVIKMVEREFPGGWTYSTRRHFRSGGKVSDIVIAIEQGEVIGFCHTADWHSAWLLPSTYWFPLLGEYYGGLGPVGMAAAHRKRGLGLAITAMAVWNLKQRGVRQMAIDWTSLVDFYGKLGFSVWKRYLQAEQKIC